MTHLLGRNKSQADRERAGVYEKLRAAPVVARGWPHQCRCGEMVIVCYRGRFYCQRCARRWVHCPWKVHGKPCPCPLADPNLKGKQT